MGHLKAYFPEVDPGEKGCEKTTLGQEGAIITTLESPGKSNQERPKSDPRAAKSGPRAA